MNGIALAKVVRERWPGVRIVLNSGRSNPSPDDHLPEDVAFLTEALPADDGSQPASPDHQATDHRSGAVGRLK